jgi:pimeloyl-ACP methyl ester carboxylesterase
MLLRVADQELFVDRAGAGRPVVLVHGLGTPSVWMKTLGPLSSSFDVTSVHLPGFGRSPVPPAPLSAADHARLLQGVLDALSLDDAILCGMSYGGQVAATLASRRPARASALVLVAASGLMRRYRFLANDLAFTLVKEAALATVLGSAASIRRWNGRLYADPAHQPPELVDEFFRMIQDPRRRASWFDCVRNAAAPEDGFDRELARIDIPTLILWGDRDRVVPVRFASTYREGIAGAQLRVFKRCGHALPLEYPEELCAAVRSWTLREASGA